MLEEEYDLKAAVNRWYSVLRPTLALLPLRVALEVCTRQSHRRGQALIRA